MFDTALCLKQEPAFDAQRVNTAATEPPSPSNTHATHWVHVGLCVGFEATMLHVSLFAAACQQRG